MRTHARPSLLPHAIEAIEAKMSDHVNHGLTNRGDQQNDAFFEGFKFVNDVTVKRRNFRRRKLGMFAPSGKMD